MSLQFDLHSFYYGEQHIIDDCRFDLSKGQTAAIIGPSGCGKTTLLNAIAGLKTFRDYAPGKHLKMGYIFQDARLIPWMTVAENLKLVKPTAKASDINDALAKVKLVDVENEYPIALSGGMQKRVSIARCFIAQPELVLLDEPFSSLDAPTAQHLVSLVNELLINSESSAILVTHNLQEALQLTDIIYFLSQKPTKIIKTLKNPLRADISNMDKLAVVENSSPVSSLAQQLLEEHPQILSGLL